MRKLVSLGAIAFSALPPSFAQTIDINFDSLPGMTNAPGAGVPVASQLSTQYLAANGVRFSSGSSFVAVVTHAPHPTTSMPNVIGGTTLGGALSYTSQITLSFFDPANPTDLATTGFVRIRGDEEAIPGTATMKAYSATGALLATTTVPDIAGGLTLQIAVPGIQRVELSQTSGTIGLDDLSFDPVVPCGSGASYCTAGTTTNGCTATMSATGTASATATSGFVLTAQAVEGQKLGLIFYGVSGAVASPWGNGTSYLCVKAPTQRTPAASSGGTSGQCDGTLSIDWNAFIAANPAALGAPFTGGESVRAQCWFRDPPSPKTTNLSDALLFSVCP